MGAITPVSDAEREQIRHRHARGESCTAIAAALGRNPGTITRQCRKMGLKFDRAATKAATEAKVADNKAKRAQLASDLLDDAQKLRERAWSQYEIPVGTGEGAEVVTLALPPLPDVRAGYTAIGVCMDKSIAQEKHDTAPDHSGDARSMLGGLLSALSGAVNGEPAEPPGGE